MKIIVHGNNAILMAIETATAALSVGIKTLTIECAPAEQGVVVFPSASAFCPTTECAECEAKPCPFSHQPDDSLAALQAEYTEAEARLLEIGDRLRGKVIHG